MSEWIYDTVNVQHDVSGTTVYERIEYYYDSETGEIKDEVAEAIAARDAEWVAVIDGMMKANTEQADEAMLRGSLKVSVAMRAINVELEGLKIHMTGEKTNDNNR